MERQIIIAKIFLLMIMLSTIVILSMIYKEKFNYIILGSDNITSSIYAERGKLSDIIKSDGGFYKYCHIDTADKKLYIYQSKTLGFNGQKYSCANSLENKITIN